MRESFIEFYGKHKISPVRQDLTNILHHYERRGSLYRHLGILSGLFTNKTILEIGPGSGHNSLYIASLEPKLYHLVEGNPTGVQSIKKLFEKNNFNKSNYVVFESLIEDFNSELKYDIVLCEGMLPGLNDPVGTLLRIKEYVSQGGVLIITCNDPISMLSESIRHLIGQLLIWDLENIDEMLGILTPVFSKHLDLLSGVTKRYDDWIIDNIINPAGIGTTLSIAEAIDAISDQFIIYSSSPKIFSDWRWYKQIFDDESKRINSHVIEQYWSLVHSFIAYDRVFDQRDEKANKILYRLCDDLRINIRYLRDIHDKSTLEEIKVLLKEITKEVNLFSTDVADALSEVLSLLKSNHISIESVNKCINFARWFGRGQQYLSFTRG
ncbi:MAG: class I SAM-dependent methyltransferase [Bacillota bacterium]